MASDGAVLFDLDGVIVDSREHHLSAWHRLAEERGLAHAPDYFTTVFGLRNDAILGGLLPDITPDELQALAGRKEELFRHVARGHVEALAGVTALLASLAERGIASAIVTSTPRENLDLIIDELGIRGRFQTLVAEEDATKGKPDPEGFLVAAERLGAAPGRCVVIEDAPAGLRAARAGGMRSIGVTTTHPAAALSDAELVVASLADARVLTFITER
ncbi:MAG TPA: HAD family phosphatase [Dehalococcoidia bacterium]|nr:HAD family phosphatase [Dehalococcoidia bacterium]